MSIKTNIQAFTKSHTVRQLAGASVGMLVAGGLYVGFEQLGSMNLAGMLVQPGVTVSENAGEVSTARKDLDEDTARRLETRAQQVADQMKQYAAMTQPKVAGTPLEQRVQQRLSDRQEQMAQFTGQNTHAAAPETYAGNPVGPVDQRERLALRAEQAAGLREAAAARAEADAQAKTLDFSAIVKAVQQNAALSSSAPALAEIQWSSSASSVPVTVAASNEAPLHGGAPLQQAVNPPKAKTLTSSGARENLLVLLTLAGAMGMYLSDPMRRARLMAVVSKAR
jgi:hypothetical protein